MGFDLYLNVVASCVNKLLTTICGNPCYLQCVSNSKLFVVINKSLQVNDSDTNAITYSLPISATPIKGVQSPMKAQNSNLVQRAIVEWRGPCMV